MPPRGRRQRARVVVGLAGEVQAVLGKVVPFLAGDLAGLAADADRGISEEPPALSGVRLVGAGPGLHAQRLDEPHGEPVPARLRYSPTSSRRPGPRGRRPGLMSQVEAL